MSENKILEKLVYLAFKYESEFYDMSKDVFTKCKNNDDLLELIKQKKDEKSKVNIYKALHRMYKSLSQCISDNLYIIIKDIVTCKIADYTMGDTMDFVVQFYGTSSDEYYDRAFDTNVNKEKEDTDVEEVKVEEKKEEVKEVVSNITFDDIAGLEEIKKEVMEVVDFLKYPDKYTRLGAKMPKGLLFEGVTGSGKTLLAKAVANEAGVKFIGKVGSDFVNKYVGVGADNVRKIFEEARSHGTCVLFIDEIDSLLPSRENANNNTERASTVNAFLACMDGIGTEKDNILVVGATNLKS